MGSGFQRRFLHYESDAVTLVGEISERAVAGCWFELHRQGGCGPGELQLSDEFPARNEIDIGDWIACEAAAGDRWYFGRVESRETDCPAGIRFELEGMGVELGEVFPGGFGSDADGVPPHRYARTDLFPEDPDRAIEIFDSVETPGELVKRLMEQYVVPATPVSFDPLLVEDAPGGAGLASFKFRGEESVRAILKDLAVRSRDACWGVDEQGAFFFIQKRTTTLAEFQEAVDVSRLEESRDRELLYNRVTLTGDYVYGAPVDSSNGVRSFYRFRGNYVQPESRDVHGERRIRLWIPWIRTDDDALGFVREFFRVYAEPTTKYLIDVPNRSQLLRPWDGSVRLLDRNGAVLIETPMDALRVQFDRAPRFRMELGPEDPHTLWPEPPQDERWEIGRKRHGGNVSLTSSQTPSSLTSGGSSGTSSGVAPSGSDGSSGSGPITSQSQSGSGSFVSSGEPSSGVTGSSDAGSSRNTHGTSAGSQVTSTVDPDSTFSGGGSGSYGGTSSSGGKSTTL